MTKRQIRQIFVIAGVMKEKPPTPVEAAPQSSAVFSAVACAVGLLLVVGLLVSAMYVRTKKQLRRDSLK
jgi:putative copper export protein